MLTVFASGSGVLGRGLLLQDLLWTNGFYGFHLRSVGLKGSLHEA